MSKREGWSILLVACGLVGSIAACDDVTDEVDGMKTEDFLSLSIDHLPNSFPIANAAGFAAAFSTTGSIDFTNDFNTPQGSNGRDCGTCHQVTAGWGIRPLEATILFLATDGTHPLYNVIDANRPDADVSTVEARWANYSMLRQGKFLRLVKPPATADYDVIAANDPFGFGTAANLLFFRRPLPTASFRSHTTMWDSANTVGTDLREGLLKQARGNITGAQQGTTPVTPEEIAAREALVGRIVDQEMGFAHAQLYMWGAGWLNAGGARGGPEFAAAEGKVQGPFNLFDAWAGSSNFKRAQIARGQAIFNSTNAANSRSCNGCHNIVNNGQNMNGTLFNIKTSDADRAKPDMAIYTFRKKGSDGTNPADTVMSTDPGRGIRNGLFADLNKFKTPNLRGLAARGPYFHNGIADTLLDVVRHYESALGFVYTAQEEADLVAFLTAL
jgi:cytochrome c peroxidase